MTKLVFLLAGGDDAAAPTLRDALLADDLRDELAAVGATRLHVNVDDGDVAAAMRIASPTGPVRAVVSVWAELSAQVGAEVAPVLDALAAALSGTGVSLGGYEVEERRPLEPPSVPDGVRTDALANVAVLRRPEDLDEAEWRHRWLVDHTPVAIETQGTFGYVQNVVLAPVTTDAPYVSAVVEELFPMAATTDLHAFYGSGGDDAELRSRMERMMASVSRFGADRGLDLVPSSRYCWSLERRDRRAIAYDGARTRRTQS
ncbi:hypothetical protein QWY28_00880 [Nocardioides sp. SOB77]|uniref:EthD domain-containing protein n=1 Tax=Nocardioides oceani TaxID=3058369 RepID=A0ABT8FA11_9ACTN|nr:hypothetical protein [Nocardioides oceani]MDN4171488.1 hypothetical protein [Nocardioides oceani]